MKWKKEFIEHLSDELRITQIEIRESLATWQGSPFEDETPKHPIELVNEKYPDGWCIATCDEVIKDLSNFYNECYGLSAIYCGVFNGKSYSSHLGFGTLITKSQYLQLTGREPNQRDWTGVRFKIKGSEIIFTLHKVDKGYVFGYRIIFWDTKEVDKKFEKGDWVELKDEPATIHVQLPNVPHYGGNDNPFPPIRIIQHYNLSFELGNVIKYVLRDKGSKIEDLKKAIDYLNFEIGKHESK